MDDFSSGTQGEDYGVTSTDPYSPQLNDRMQQLATQAPPPMYVTTPDTRGKTRDDLDWQQTGQKSINPAYQAWLDNRRDYSNALEDAQYEKDQKDFLNWQVTNRLTQAYDGIQKDANNTNLDASLADRLSKAAQDVMQIDPKRGMEIYDQAAKYNDKANTQTLEALNVKKAKLGLATDIYGTIADNDSFQKARLSLAGLGPEYAIPPQYQTYDDNAKKFIENRAQFSPKAISAMKAKISEQQATISAVDLQMRIHKDIREQNAADAKEATARNPKVKALTVEQQPIYQSELSTYIPDTWDNVTDPKSKIAAANEWYSKIAQYQAAGKDADTAKALAAKDVNSMISSDGVFTPKQVASAQSTQAKTAPQAAIDYLKAHPETQDKFKATFGYLP